MGGERVLKVFSMNLIKNVSMLGVGLLATLSLQGTSYTDEAAWQAAVPSFGLENFEGFAQGTELNVLNSLDIEFDFLNNGINYPSVQPTLGGFSHSGSNILLNHVEAALPGLGDIIFHPLNPGDFILGVGYWNTGGDDTTTLSFFDSGNNLIESSNSGSGLVFNGIVSIVPASFVRISELGGNGFFTIDNLQVALTIVPEPSTLFLPLLILGIVIWQRQDRKRRTGLA